MTIYFECPWCGREDDIEFEYVPIENYCSYCNGKIAIYILKGWGSEKKNEICKEET